MAERGEGGERRRQDAGVGLCASCTHVRVITSRRGSRFYRCGLADVDPRFVRYPRLPVVACAGYAPRGDGGPAEEVAE